MLHQNFRKERLLIVGKQHETKFGNMYIYIFTISRDIIL